MSDDTHGRDVNTDDEEPNRPDRKQGEVRDRADGDRAMSGDLGELLGDLDEALETQEYPMTTNELVEAYGDSEIQTQGGTQSLEEVLARTDNQVFESEDDVRKQILGLTHR